MLSKCCGMTAWVIELSIKCNKQNYFNTWPRLYPETSENTWLNNLNILILIFKVFFCGTRGAWWKWWQMARLWIFSKKGQQDLWMIWLWNARKLEKPCNRRERRKVTLKLATKSKESIVSICRCWDLNWGAGSRITGEVYKGWRGPWGRLGSKAGKEDKERKGLVQFPADSAGCLDT